MCIRDRYEVCPKNLLNFFNNRFLVTLAAIQPGCLQSFPLYFRHTSAIMCSILQNISGSLHLGHCTVLLVNLSLPGQLTENVSLSTSFLIWEKYPPVLSSERREWGIILLSYFFSQTDRVIALCTQAHCQHGVSISLTARHQALSLIHI